ncbi:hypothetical protein DI383_14410 [Flavobacteriaceae bacterium LYZ1037]|nr:hypothetical protein DI383_14410 [Flavobacteriaceae bacterium LYZ1037]
MADPICRWRNPYLPTVIELINILPKEEMSQVQAREIINATSPNYFNAPFFKTPYQTACQLGLYHETNGHYFPKFTFDPTEEEVLAYMTNWIAHYCVPNPYTNGFDNIEPFSIHAELCRRLYETQNNIDWTTFSEEIFEGEIGNDDILVNSINAYSTIISINGGLIQLKGGKTYEELTPFINIDVNIDRNNKEYFFDLFIIPEQDQENEQNQDVDLVTNISRQEYQIINQVQNLPNLTQTEKNQIIKSRIGQGYFRRSLIQNCGYCPMTLIDDTRLLTASHIKPWRDCTNEERLNVNNGILLTPTYDRLFDKGYISFRNDKSLIISSLISENNIQKLGLTQNMQIEHLPIVGREIYLEYHRDVILQN